MSGDEHMIMSVSTITYVSTQMWTQLTVENKGRNYGAVCESITSISKCGH